MKIRVRDLFLALSITCLLAGCWGCGTTEYDALLHKRTMEVRSSAKFLTLFGPMQLADSPFEIRVPMVFRGSFVATSAHPEDGGRIAPDRLQPPFLQIPGFKHCFEAGLPTPEGQLPAYCYLAALPAKPGEAAKLETDLAKQLKDKFPETGAWEAADCATPDGKTIAWRKIGFTADQPFRFKDPLNAQKLTEKLFPATFELWMYDAGEAVCLVGWRVPAAIEGKSTPPTDADPSTGVPGRPAVEKVDMATMPALTAGSLTVNPTADAPQ